MLSGFKFSRTWMKKNEQKKCQQEERMGKYPESRVTMDRFIKRKNAKDYITARKAQGKE